MNNQDKSSWVVTVEEDPDTGDTILPFPPDMMTQLDWREGDTIDFQEKDGNIFIANLSWLARTHPDDN